MTSNRASPFRTWNDRDAFRIHQGVSIHSIGGEQTLLCRVTYAPGTTVARHAHAQSEQVMAIVEGEVTMTVGDETTTLRAGDVAVVNRGIDHELYSENGVTFFEGLAPVPIDHVGDPEQDLVLGPEGGSLHVDR